MMDFQKIKRFLIGEPLSNVEIREAKIPKWKALAVLSSDALSSVAYATEEMLIPLSLFSVAAMAWSVPVGMAIVILMLIVAMSYRQTVLEYSNGGGAYVVSRENLGTNPALVAAASLLCDYVLTVSVSVAAGVHAITSAFPELIEHRVLIGVSVIFLLTLMNLRGIRESASVFALPTYTFIISFFVMILVGAYKAISIKMGGGDVAVPHLNPVIEADFAVVPVALVLTAFSSGCAALTGIEAISNAVPTFRPPAEKNASKTLAMMALILSCLFFGITALSHVYGIAPVVSGGEGEAAVSQLARSIFGANWFYYLIQISTALILVLAANTSYNGFPWLAAVLARDRFLPRQLAILGDKLVYSNSIIGLSVTAAILIIIFKADTHALIPLYAVGVFVSFTLSQAGMVRYHFKKRKPGWGRSAIMCGVGSVATLVVTGVITYTKFMHGAWIVVLLIPTFMLFFRRINRHYLQVGKELSLVGVAAPEHLEPFHHTAIVPISGIHRGVVDALKYALSISKDVRACYVEINPETTTRMQEEWEKWAGDIPLIVIRSPYRSVIRPILEYIDDLDKTTHGDVITVIIPEFVTKRWWHRFLHNQTAIMIRAALMFRRGKVVTSVRYHLKG